MNTSIIKRHEIRAYESILNLHLSKVFGDNNTVLVNQEFECAVLIEDNNNVVAAGFAYSRVMAQVGCEFHAGIIGGISVDKAYRGHGLGKKIVQNLDDYLLSREIRCSFLFAYEPNIYRSSGYKDLNVPIHYFDEKQQRWNKFMYRGGMVKLYTHEQPLNNILIEFNGCVY